MVETLGQSCVDVLPLQPMDSHFIYQAVNLKAPTARQPRPPAPDHVHPPGQSVALNFYHAILRPPLDHTLSLTPIN